MDTNSLEAMMQQGRPQQGSRRPPHRSMSSTGVTANGGGPGLLDSQLLSTQGALLLLPAHLVLHLSMRTRNAEKKP